MKEHAELLQLIMARMDEITGVQEPYRRYNEQGETICYYCARSLAIHDVPNADHVTPVAGGGLDEKWNLVWACQGCNYAKSDKHPLDYVQGGWPLTIQIDYLARILLHSRHAPHAPVSQRRRRKSKPKATLERECAVCGRTGLATDKVEGIRWHPTGINMEGERELTMCCSLMCRQKIFEAQDRREYEQWYKDNHVLIEVVDENSGQVFEMEVPKHTTVGREPGKRQQPLEGRPE